MNTQQPQKPAIHPMWHNLFLRMQSGSRGETGLVFMRVDIVCSDGKPLLWPEPKIVKIEPRKDINIDILKNNMTDEEAFTLLSAILSGR